MKFIQSLILLSASLMLLSCANQSVKPNIQEKVLYWKVKLDKEIPKHTNQREIRQWAIDNKLSAFSYNEKMHEVYGHLESIKLPSYSLCDSTFIYAKIKTDSQGYSIENEVGNGSICL